MRIFTDHEIASLIRKGSIVDREPWNAEGAHEAFYRRILAEIEEKSGVCIKAEFNAYGSGYASFVDAFCYPGDDASRINHQEPGVEYAGIAILLSRLGNFYTLGKVQKSWSDTGGSSYLPDSRMSDDFTEPFFQAPLKGIREVLARHGMREIRVGELQTPIDVPYIPTILDDGSYKEFDALYFWHD